MFRLILILATVLAASTANAQRVYNLPAGQYLITGEVRSVGPVISPDGPVVPPPVVPPVVPPVSTFTKAVTAAVNAIQVSDKRHESAMKLSATYQMLAGQVKDGKIHPTSAVQAAELICPIALGGDKAAWMGVFGVVNAEVAKAADAGACASIFTAAADAVLATVPAGAGEDLSTDAGMQAAAARYGFDWTAFMAFLMELLKILLPLIISAVKVASGMVIC